jgi:hypothetical protein
MDIPASLLGLVAYAYFFWVLPLAAPVFMLNLTPQVRATPRQAA